MTSTATLVMLLNAAAVGALLMLSFNPQRQAFGRATGLWHPCLPMSGGGVSYERWSPVLLVLVIPAAPGLSLARGRAGPMSMGLRIVSVLLGAAAVLAVVVPTGSCIS